MIRSFLRRRLLKNKALFFREAECISAFCLSLDETKKQRRKRWTPYLPFPAEEMDREGASTAGFPAARNPLEELWRV
jgi:hypothetical protein